jgi:aarF domain-containing kinase
VDLAREATHLHAFNYNFRSTAGVSFPVPLYPLVKPAVLVETFEAGTHISAYVARGPGAPHNSELARLGARTMLHMLIVDNLIHADLHPGNILVTLDLPFGRPLNALVTAASRAADALGFDSAAWLDSWQRAKLVLLDAGMAMRLSKDDQRNMFGLFEAFAEMDGARLADWVLRFSGEEQSCPDPERFKTDVALFFDKLTAETQATGATHGADALADVLEMVRTHQVNMPGHICATVVTTMVLEGWSNQLDPNHSTLQGGALMLHHTHHFVHLGRPALLHAIPALQPALPSKITGCSIHLPPCYCKFTTPWRQPLHRFIRSCALQR